jgi:hypothetical protein
MAMGLSDSFKREASSIFQAVSSRVRVDKDTAYPKGRKLDDPSGTSGEGETPQQLTKIFLTCLHDHFIKVLEDRLSPAVVRTTPMDFVVTVPAIWSPAAKQATERAAAMAGFCSNRRIILVSEPVGQQ